jgi:hypothetical protein
MTRSSATNKAIALAIRTAGIADVRPAWKEAVDIYARGASMDQITAWFSGRANRDAAKPAKVSQPVAQYVATPVTKPVTPTLELGVPMLYTRGSTTAWTPIQIATVKRLAARFPGRYVMAKRAHKGSKLVHVWVGAEKVAIIGTTGNVEIVAKH